jgi:hypothetical protein
VRAVAEQAQQAQMLFQQPQLAEQVLHQVFQVQV